MGVVEVTSRGYSRNGRLEIIISIRWDYINCEIYCKFSPLGSIGTNITCSILMAAAMWHAVQNVEESEVQGRFRR